MDQIRITGGQKLNGTISISGAKNAALPLMIASLLTRETLTLANLPRLADVAMLKRILTNHGVDHSVDGKRIGQDVLTGETVHFTAREIVDQTAPYDHCNMTVLDDGHPATARFVEVLQAMSYDDPVVRPLLDLEGLTRWLPGRTSGYAALERAVTRDGSLAAWLATVGPR